MGSLRSRAENRFTVPLNDANHYPQEKLPELIRELEIHKIELELQNEDLRAQSSQLEQNKEQLACLFDYAPVGYLTLGPTGQIFQANHCSASLLGRPRPQLIGLSVYEFLADEHRDQLFRYLRHVFNDQTPISYTTEVLRVDGSCFDAKLDIVIQPNTVDYGGIQCLMLLSDVTELVRAEAESQAVKDETELLNREKCRFLAAASHDLRQPLQAITSINDLLKKTVKDTESISQIYKQADSLKDMSKLLNLLLNVSQLESGSMSPTQVAFPVSELLESIEHSYGASVSDRDLCLQVVQSSAIVVSDMNLLEQILDNLVSNAIRYTEVGKILVGCRRRESSLLIEIWDTGIGIATDKRELVFKEFYQINNSAREYNMGFGLGLAITARIARLLDVEIGLRSWTNGSVFSVEIPLATEFDHVVTAIPVDFLSEQNTEISQKSLLIVDDNHIVLDALTCLFEQEGYAVIGALSQQGVDGALESAVKPFDLVITDFLLPDEVTGIGIIQTVRAFFRTDIPGVIITGQPDAVSSMQAEALDVPVLQKPVPAEQLVHHIQRLLTKYGE